MRARLRDPLLWIDVVQLVKTVAAALIAWELAVHVFSLEQPFLAPWAALLTVHATVYRTLRRGLQQVAAVVLGVLLAFGIGATVGANVLSLAVAILIALLAGAVRGLRSEPTTAAATALVVLATGYADDGELLVARLLDTAIGIGVGVAITLIVWAPLRDRAAASEVDRIDDRIGDLLRRMADAIGAGFGGEEVEAWIDASREIDGDIESAWRTVGEARESFRLNPRPHAAARARATEDFEGVLRRLEQAVAEIRSIAGTLGRAQEDGERLLPAFREPWTVLLRDTGEGIAEADAGRLARVRDGLTELSEELAADELASHAWPRYGALIVNLRTIVDVMGTVAEVQPVRVQARGHGSPPRARPAPSTAGRRTATPAQSGASSPSPPAGQGR